MSIHDRKGLAHSRKVTTSSVETTKPRYSVDPAFQSPARKSIISARHGSPTFIIGERLSHRHNNQYLGNFQDLLEVKKTPTVFVGISKPSAAIDRLVLKRKTDHGEAVKNMRDELAASYAACEQEFRNRSISVKIEINKIHRGIGKTRDELREINLCDLHSKDYDLAWTKMSASIEEEKRFIDNFHKSLLIIEKKRQEYSKSILRKYYKIFHKISFLLPYEIQVYMENEILNYNEVVLGNHRIYADLNLQMLLIADAEKIKFKNWIEELKIDNREAILDIDNN